LLPEIWFIYGAAILRKYYLVWKQLFNYGAAIHRIITCCGRSGSLQSCYSKETLVSVGAEVHIRSTCSHEILVTLGAVVNLRRCYSQETLAGLGTVVYLRSCYSQEFCGSSGSFTEMVF
jgi:hypothetical protein